MYFGISPLSLNFNNINIKLPQISKIKKQELWDEVVFFIDLLFVATGIVHVQTRDIEHGPKKKKDESNLLQRNCVRLNPTGIFITMITL